jgi:DNA modification methylase
LPDKLFWDKIKDVLHLEEYDKHVKEEYKNIMMQFNPLGSNPGDVIDNGDAEDFMSISTLPHSFVHFAVYPETLIAPLIKAGCPKGGIVLDPFAGSGTTGVVAEILGRDSVLIEISPEYIKIIEDRMKTENIEKVRQMLIKKGMIEK